jgi:hypothetical protein
MNRYHTASKEDIIGLAAIIAVMVIMILIAEEMRNYMERRKRK